VVVDCHAEDLRAAVDGRGEMKGVNLCAVPRCNRCVFGKEIGESVVRRRIIRDAVVVVDSEPLGSLWRGVADEFRNLSTWML